METSSPSKILVLDDEPAQRMAIHLQLAGLGQFIDFGDPREAVAFLENNKVDAAIVDIRMPSMPVDGLWFLHELRARDSVLGVVLRTADDDVSIAQAGIEARAVQRVIKADRNAKGKLREAAIRAIEETRERRDLALAAAHAAEAKANLLLALGRTDDELTIVEMVMGFTQSLSPHITTLAGYADILRDLAPKITDARAREMAVKSADAAFRVSVLFTEFMSNPFMGAAVSGTCSGNACIDALVRVTKMHPLFTDAQHSLVARGSLPDAIVSVEATKMLTCLRHLTGYCAQHADTGGPVSVSWSRCASAESWLKEARNVFVLNPRFSPSGACAVFSVSAKIGRPSHADLREAFRHCPDDPRTGNLFLVAAVTFDERLLLAVSDDVDETTFRVFVPVL